MFSNFWLEFMDVVLNESPHRFFYVKKKTSNCNIILSLALKYYDILNQGSYLNGVKGNLHHLIHKTLVEKHRPLHKLVGDLGHRLSSLLESQILLFTRTISSGGTYYS